MCRGQSDPCKGEPMAKAQASAETLGLQALGWLAGQDELFQTFLGATGASAQEAAARATEPEFLAAVLDFLLMDDQWIIGFCDAAGLPYDRPLQARAMLPGGPGPHWT